MTAPAPLKVNNMTKQELVNAVRSLEGTCAMQDKAIHEFQISSHKEIKALKEEIKRMARAVVRINATNPKDVHCLVGNQQIPLELLRDVYDPNIIFEAMARKMAEELKQLWERDHKKPNLSVVSDAR